MTLYIVRRIAAAAVLALLVTFITFILLAPSFDGIVRTLVGTGATQETVDAMKTKLGFDRPVLVQYFDWLGGVFTGDFGKSLFTNEPVTTAVLQRLGVTLSVIVTALILTVIISISLGVWAATRGGAVDKIAQGLSLSGNLVPSLLVAVALVFVFAITFRLLPATGFTPFANSPLGWAASIALPVIALAITAIANMSAQVRGGMIDELRKDYVRTLRTRGLSSRSIVLKHALRNAAGPALTVLGFEFLAMLGGALFIEKVFALPGYGTLALTSALRGDIMIILGITVFGVFLTVVVNLAVDIVNGLLTPKARLY